MKPIEVLLRKEAIFFLVGTMEDLAQSGLPVRKGKHIFAILPVDE